MRLTDRPYLLLVITMLGWGGNAVAGRLAVGEISPALLITLRWGVVLALLAAFRRREVMQGWAGVRARWGRVLLMGAGGFTAFNAFFYEAAHYTSAVNISILQGSVPALVMLGALTLHRTPVRAGQVVGLALTLFGVALTAGRGDLGALAALRVNLGDALMLAGCILYAGYTLSLARWDGPSGFALFAGLSLAAFVTSLPFVGLEAAAGRMQWPTAQGWAVLAYAATVPSLLSQVFYMRAVGLIGPGRAGLFINLVPVFGALLSVLMLGEPFAPFHAGALALVLVGILLAERSARRGASPVAGADPSAPGPS